MKVILNEDIKKIGKKNDLIEVKDGYAINYLLRKQLAKRVTKKTLFDLEKEKSQKNTKLAKEIKAVTNLKAKFEKEIFNFEIKFNSKTKKSSSAITPKIITKTIDDYLKANSEVTFSKKQYKFNFTTINKPGNYVGEIKLINDIIYKIKIKVINK